MLFPKLSREFPATVDLYARIIASSSSLRVPPLLKRLRADAVRHGAVCAVRSRDPVTPSGYVLVPGAYDATLGNLLVRIMPSVPLQLAELAFELGVVLTQNEWRSTREFYQLSQAFRAIGEIGAMQYRYAHRPRRAKHLPAV
jgi:hypothetical protein